MTPLADGRVLVTTDNNDEGDVSGLYVTKRVLNVAFPRCWPPVARGCRTAAGSSPRSPSRPRSMR